MEAVSLLISIAVTFSFMSQLICWPKGQTDQIAKSPKFSKILIAFSVIAFSSAIVATGIMLV